MWHIKKAHSFYPDMTKVKVAESESREQHKHVNKSIYL